MKKFIRLYWVGLKASKFVAHSGVYRSYEEAEKRLNSYGKPDRAVLKIYHIDAKPSELGYPEEF